MFVSKMIKWGETLRKFFKDILTGKDNQTYDMGRLLWVQGAISYCIIAFFAVYKGQHWDPIAFGSGFAAILAAGGAALKIKESTEPNKNGDDSNTLNNGK